MTATTMLDRASGQERNGDDTLRLAASAIAEELTSYYLNVSSPGRDGSHYLRVTNVPGMLCEISIRADGSVEWERRPCEGREADAACTAETVLAILDAGADALSAVMPGRCRCGISFKGTAGRMLAGRGMRVTLQTYPDQLFFEVYSEIDVTNPVRPERGTVSVADDGSIIWRCRVRKQPDDTCALDPAQIAGAIAHALTERRGPDTRPLRRAERAH